MGTLFSSTVIKLGRLAGRNYIIYAITMKKLVSRANNISTCPAKPLEQVQVYTNDAISVTHLYTYHVTLATVFNNTCMASV